MDLLKSCLFVGLGGFAGAVIRFLISSLPVKTTFPLLTFLINIAAAIMMGFFVGIFRGIPGFNNQLYRFLTTGLCGGFSTLSALGAETIDLFQSNHYFIGTGYALISVAGCLGGILLGEFLASLVIKTT